MGHYLCEIIILGSYVIVSNKSLIMVLLYKF